MYFTQYIVRVKENYPLLINAFFRKIFLCLDLAYLSQDQDLGSLYLDLHR